MTETDVANFRLGKAGLEPFEDFGLFEAQRMMRRGLGEPHGEDATLHAVRPRESEKQIAHDLLPGGEHILQLHPIRQTGLGHDFRSQIRHAQRR